MFFLRFISKLDPWLLNVTGKHVVSVTHLAYGCVLLRDEISGVVTADVGARSCVQLAAVFSRA